MQTSDKGNGALPHNDALEIPRPRWIRRSRIGLYALLFAYVISFIALRATGILGWREEELEITIDGVAQVDQGQALAMSSVTFDLLCYEPPKGAYRIQPHGIMMTSMDPAFSEMHRHPLATAYLPLHFFEQWGRDRIMRH